MKKLVVFIFIVLLFFSITLSGCTEDEVLSEVLKSDNPEYIVVSIDANVRVNGHPDLWDPVPGVPVEINIVKDGGESHRETKTTGDNGETGIVHTSFNLYRKQSIVFDATYYGSTTIGNSKTLAWETVEQGANEVGMYSWNPLIILVVEDI
jgi:hypothetical protein